MNWLHYLAEANIYLGVFYLAYCVFLTKETHYQLNRGYLLFSCVMSFVLPVLQVGALKPAEPVAVTTSYIVPREYIPAYETTAKVAPVVIEEHHLTLQDYLWYAYIIGAGVLLIVLAIKLCTLFKLIRNAQRVKKDKYKLVYLPETDVAFSFFNYLFIGNNAPGANTIIMHELVHIRQRHSVDIIFLELLKVVSWFNPFIYLLQNSLKTVHEYIADEQTATYESDALAYSSFLVNNAYGAGGSSITHSFFNYNLLKKRIIMLNQQRSDSTTRLKYLLALPLCAGLLCVSTLAFSKTYGWVDIDPAKTVKVDAIKPSPQTPVKPAALKLSPPIVKPDIKDVHPPFTYKDKHGGTVSAFRIHNALLDLNAGTIKYPRAIYFIDGKRYIFNKQQEAQLSAGASIAITADSMITYLKGSAYAISKWGKEAEKRNVVLLYGDASIKVVDEGQKPHRVVDSLDKTPVSIAQPDTVAKPDWQKIGKYFANTIKYPAVDRQETIGGRVITIFAVDADHNLQYAKVVRSPSDLMSNEVIRTLQACTELGALKPGVQYVLPVSFTLGYADANNSTEVLLKSRSTGSAKIYNPNSIDIPINPPGSLILNDIVIRGYIKKPATPGKTSGDVIQPDLSEFKRYFVNAVEYPAELGKQGVGGTVMTNFSIDNNHKVGSIKVMLSPSDRLSNEVINALKAMPAMAAMKPGDTYQFPVYFTPPSGVPLKKSILTSGSVIAYKSSSAIPPSGNLIGITGMSFRSY